ncbi:hypothetical protein [Synechocystis sp. LKSZ1]|uniref:O-linked N-acetylglucosamine transferase, SPINDLY family protein n=1 Tax=Synechocystis sp. LKSZ1 TaxID=3144951 RepID=UPI00336C183C
MKKNLEFITITPYLEQGLCQKATNILLKHINEEPKFLDLYWYLGLAYLFQGDEEKATEAWWAGLNQAWEMEVLDGALLLSSFLIKVAEEQENKENYDKALIIRERVQEIDSNNINNTLTLIKLAYFLNIFDLEKLAKWQVIDKLNSNTGSSIDSGLLLECIPWILSFPTALSIDFLEASLPYLKDQDWLTSVMHYAIELADAKNLITYATDIAQICLKFEPDNYCIINQLLYFYEMINNQAALLKTAWQFYHCIPKHSQEFGLECYILSRVLRILLLQGCWADIDREDIINKLRSALIYLEKQPKLQLNSFLSPRFWSIGLPLLYLFDDLLENRRFINSTSQKFQEGLIQENSLRRWKNKDLDNNRPLKIGYIGHSLRKHSVGWLSRWLFHYHDKQRFNLYFYLINQVNDELTKQWIIPNATQVYNLENGLEQALDQIQTDEIDILVDLDGLMGNMTANILAFKPVPIQVTWLGSDASGLPSIDYFIVDPYVLPKGAQNYYTEKLWCLPDTYLAIDGFEVGTATLSRGSLGINEHAVIYLSVQSSLKYNPQLCRLQLKIIQAVPSSIFLIKGIANNQGLQDLIATIAREVGVNINRIKFLPRDSDELTHRANLAIADIVLDTYPYSGATTTLETLWMEIPLVTRVGEQFSARNSYTFLTQVGVEQGIAWTDEEYVEWGVKLGQAPLLRRQIKRQLRKAKQTSVLWKAELFTREIEKAYESMWQTFVKDN